MADTNIEWTQRSWNPVVGCSIKSAGCTNCYAMPRAARLVAMGVEHYRGLTHKVNGNTVWTGKLALNKNALLEPLRRKKPTIWFVNSMGDLFHEDCPDDWIDRVFAVMALCPQHTFQVLTKRSDRMREYFTGRTEISPPLNGEATFPRARGHVERWANLIGLKNKRDLPWRARHESGGYWWGFRADMPWPLPNVWLGVSVEDQRAADTRIPDLLSTPAALRWLSCEPLLGPVDLTFYDSVKETLYEALTGHSQDGVVNAGNRLVAIDSRYDLNGPKLDWIVVGGESGKDARPMHPDWARSLRDQCAAAGVPFFFKQWGEWVPLGDDDGWWPATSERCIRLTYSGKRMEHGWPMQRVGKKSAGRLLEGVLHDTMPQVQP